MCSTLEYASIRLKSRCPAMNTAATPMERSPRATNSSRANAPSPAGCMTR